MADLAIQYLEDRSQRRIRNHEIGKIHVRVYNAPKTMTLPVKGAALPGWDGTETGLQVPRIIDVSDGPQQSGGGQNTIVITSIQPLAYTAGTYSTGFMETKGSRQEQRTNDGKYTVLLGVGDGTETAPVRGTYLSGDSGLWGRRVDHYTTDTTTVPGLTFYRVSYFSYLSNSGTPTNYGHIMGGIDYSETDTETIIQTKGICSDRTNGDVPAIADVWSGDSGLGQRVCIDVKADDEPYPGVFLVYATWRGFKLSSTTITTGTKSITLLKTYPKFGENVSEMWVEAHGVSAATDAGPSTDAASPAYWSTDSGIWGRRCELVEESPNVQPGMYYYVLKYRAYKSALASPPTNYGHIAGKIDKTSSPGRRHVKTVGVCSDKTHADVPEKGDVFSDAGVADTGNNARICTDVQIDDDVLPGLHLVYATWLGLNITGTTINSMNVLEDYPQYTTTYDQSQIVVRGIAASTNLGPAVADAWNSETGLDRRVCVRRSPEDTFTIPGKFIVEAVYMGFKPYTAGTYATGSYMEIKGSRKTTERITGRAIVTIGVYDSTETAAPQQGTAYTGDSDLKRICTEVRDDPTVIPGLIVRTAVWENATEYVE